MRLFALCLTFLGVTTFLIFGCGTAQNAGPERRLLRLPLPAGLPAGPLPLIRNPVLPGFNPDPDILRVGDDYYIATTTFEWFPGVNIYHSKDLVNWRLACRPLTEKHLQLSGVPNSGGNYIPSLTYHESDNRFYLVYSNVLGRDWPLMSMRSYVTTAETIDGPWSDPVYLNGAGFDPALFFAPDGKAYLINMVLDYRSDLQMPGFLLQEYDWREHRLTGVAKMIFHLDNYPDEFRYSYPEGPHLYFRNGYYYLLFAAGGTYWNHQSWLARSKSIWGPYELSPYNPLLTSVGIAPGGLQKAGQGGLVETQNGEWYLAHHAARPMLPDSVSPLGRETCLQRVEWTTDGWLRLEGGGIHPRWAVAAPDLPPHPFPGSPAGFDFDAPTLPVDFQSLREPMDSSWLSLRRRPGHLSIRGRQPISALIGQSLIARRWTSLDFAVETALEFQPTHFLQMAGLTLFYDTEDFQFAYVTHDEKKGRVARLLRRSKNAGWEKFNTYEKDLPEQGQVKFRVVVGKGVAQFFCAGAQGPFEPLGPALAIAHLSDEGINGDKNGFTGAFVGLSVQDRLYEKSWAAIDYFHYRPAAER